jgi:hypothetical protein
MENNSMCREAIFVSNPSIFNSVNKHTKKTVTPQDIQRVAKNIKPAMLQDEQQMRQLVRSIGDMAGIKVPDKTVREIAKMVQGGQLPAGQLEQMIRTLTQPKA